MAETDKPGLLGSLANQEQLKGMGERLATIIATWVLARAVAKGYIAPEDSGVLLPGLIILIVAAPSVLYGWWVNRGKSLAQALAKVVPETVVVTSPDIAKNTPELNIVSNTNVKVVTDGEVIVPTSTEGK